MNLALSTRAAISLLIAFAASCAPAPPDPAKEAPVDPAPGLYQITISAGSLGKGRGGDVQKPICLRANGVKNFGQKLAENYYTLHSSCSLSAAPRVGNVISGDIRCAADERLAKGSNRFVYRGVIAKEAVNVTVQIKFDATPKAGTEADTMQVKLAMKAVEMARFSIDAVRTGECP